MTGAIQKWVRDKVDGKVIPACGAILEIGAMDVNGSVREFFNQYNYRGVDIEKGPGVDYVCDAHNLNYADESFDVIICLEMLEHDTKPWLTVAHMHRMLRKGGVLLISTPANGFPEHRYPVDCFRYLEDAYKNFFFEGMDIMTIDKVSSTPNEYTLIGCARKRG